ncbi:PhzF family phenazine biosynthesis protein [Halioxenophilus sp. WMMB6]|uniref:PhzF family phenazine biosynthesis protein n=1 Tax=Halioxenophilus sp. WMMB6 TaxID=3073815 RepID=UPI00295EBFA0|nr:PhzF family phenazine biosynthesis protein [Halioxenophilus sp. WMMB6]
MTIPNNLFIVKAFASAPFTGNPAAVCILPELLPEPTLQQIAKELNQPITSFVVPTEHPERYQLRHYGPKHPVEICGHGTVAASHVLREHLNHRGENIFFSLGRLDVRVGNFAHGFELELPNFSFRPVGISSGISRMLGDKPIKMYKSFYDVIAEFPSERAVRNLKPDFDIPLDSTIRALLVTAPGDCSDYCYRVFAPSIGVDEDYFCGSANGALGPLWRYKLNKSELLGYSVSERGGEIPCFVDDKTVKIIGKAHTWFSGSIAVGNCA